MAPDPAVSDEKLARVAAIREPKAALESAHAAFQELYDRHARSLIAFLLGRVPRADVEDVHQEVWTRVWRGLPRFDGRNFRAWLFRIARNVIIDLGRGIRPGPLSDLPDPGPGPPDGLPRQEEAERLEHCLERLAPLAACLVRARLSGQSYAQVCAQLEITADAAYRLFHQARQELQDCVNQERE